jgi:hypothetical protein
MEIMIKHLNNYLLFIFLCLIISPGNPKAQMITGTWKGLIDKKKVELKIIQNGDSLFGTSYYYESPTVYKRYSIKGYFDGQTNETIWWDDQLIEEKKGRSIFKSPGSQPYLSSADFNCPGNDKMFLDGKAYLPPDRSKVKGKVNLEKTDAGIFNDEWDFIIDNYTAGANDPYLIDSVAAIASNPFTIPETIKADQPVRKETETIVEEKKVTIAIPADTTKYDKPVEIQIEKVQTPTIEEKFIKREKIIAVEIPVAGDSIELRFYDNAEIDGDSISLFMNDKMIFQHIRLKASAYVIKISVKELQQTNELVMVAENLGTIPPNTSYMLAIADNKRYEAMLKSTEETSAVIRIIKK